MSFFSLFLYAAPSSIVASLPATWSPWDQSQLFLQQRNSLITQQPLSTQNKISRYLQSLNKITMITNRRLHRHQMTPIKSENVDFSPLARSRLKVNQKTLKATNRTYSSRSLTTEKTSLNLAEHNKYLSNSLNCLTWRDLRV